MKLGLAERFTQFAHYPTNSKWREEGILRAIFQAMLRLYLLRLTRLKSSENQQDKGHEDGNYRHYR